MRIDPELGTPLARRSGPPLRRSPWLVLLNAVMALGANKGELIRHAEKPWASATFSGTRHTIALRFAGAEAIAAAEHLIAAIPDHEFTLPGQLVADAVITEVEHFAEPQAALSLEVELLLLED